MHNLDKGDLLREVTVKIRLERIDTQEGITVEVLFVIVQECGQTLD